MLEGEIEMGLELQVPALREVLHELHALIQR